MKFIWKSNGAQNIPDFIYAVLESDGAEHLKLNAGNDLHSFAFASSQADCLNAEHSQTDAIIWSSTEFERLKALSPKKADYGWVLSSINTPIFVQIGSLSDLEKLAEIKYDGVYSEDLDLLLEIQNNQD